MVSPSSLTAGGRVGLRPAGDRDFGFFEALYLEMFRLLVPRTDDAEIRRHFRNVYRSDQTSVVVRDGRAIGYVQIEDGPDEVMLSQIHLVPACRGLGIGTALIRELLGQAQAEGKAVTLNVLDGNPAVALYERLGFGVVGRDGPRLQMRWWPEPSSPAAGDVSRSGRRRRARRT